MSGRIVGQSAREAESHRLLAGANAAALATLVPVALHQLGVVDHLPDPPKSVFDSDRITDSSIAHPFGIPDALLGIASYGTTLLLIRSASRSHAVRRFLGVKLLLDGGAAAFNATRQVVRFGKVCSWCMGTAAATAVMVYAGRQLIAGVFAGERGDR
ncbi:MAG TPA: vitamin K epoxide reductase family protein [Acidobacteriaceae bacterium]|nr:vitamin K epoxide reductase family protein [Acidobacteriaceae bacterium]